MAKATFLHSFVIIIIAHAVLVDCFPIQNKNVVYTRYVRRRPLPDAPNEYFDEVIEVFNTRRRPPPYAFLHDKDLTRFVRCDFNPNLPDCDGAGAPVTSSTPTRKTTYSETTSAIPTTTKSQHSWLFTNPTMTSTTASSLFNFDFESSPTTTAKTRTTSEEWTNPATTSTTASSLFSFGFGSPSTTTAKTTTLPDEWTDLDTTSTTSSTTTTETEWASPELEEEKSYEEEYDEREDETDLENETDDTEYIPEYEIIENTTETQKASTTKKSLFWF